MTQVPNYPTPTPGDPASMVKGPAIGLMVTGGLWILVQIVVLLLGLFGVAMMGAMGAQQGMLGMMSGAFGMVVRILSIIIGVVIVLGAMKMMKLQSYGLAMTASILAMIPCSVCCLLGLPIGIWALVILLKPEVKAAFTA